MKFTAKLATTALVLALSTATAFAVSPTYQALADQVAKVNQLTLDKNATTAANISEERFDVLRKVIKNDFSSMSYDQKVAHINKIRTTYEQLLSDEKVVSGKDFAKKVVEALKDPALVIAQEDAVVRTKNAEVELPIEEERLMAQYVTVPLLESQLHVRAAQAVDSQLHLNLLNQLNQLHSQGAPFVLGHATNAFGADFSNFANQVVAGYKASFKSGSLYDVAVFGDFMSNATKRDMGGLDFTSGLNSYGLGAYGQVSEQGFKVSALATMNQGSQALDANVNYTQLVNSLLDPDYKQAFTGIEKNQTPLTADTTTTNLLLKGTYTIQVDPQLQVTPGLVYHFHNFNASNQKITDNSKTFGITEKLSVQTPFIPAISLHGVGATVDATYQLRQDVTLGAQASLLYYSGNNYATPHVEVVAKEVPIEGNYTETKREITINTTQQSTSYLNFNLGARAEWQLNQQVTLGANVGYSYFSELPLHGINYQLNLGYKF